MAATACLDCHAWMTPEQWRSYFGPVDAIDLGSFELRFHCGCVGTARLELHSSCGKRVPIYCGADA